MAAVWVSYAELAEHLGISPEAARQKSIRARWQRKLGDDGKARVLVDLEEAAAAGASIVRSGAETFWGGYSGVFLDPDGHPWEVAHNPFWTLGADGSVSLG